MSYRCKTISNISRTKQFFGNGIRAYEQSPIHRQGRSYRSIRSNDLLASSSSLM